MEFERANVLGVPVDLVTSRNVLDFVRERIERRQPAQIVTVNPEFVVLAQANREFATVLREAALATPDGAGILWALARQGKNLPSRVGGADLIWLICEQAAQEGHRVFLLGGAEGVAARAAAVLQTRYSGLLISGSNAGNPSSDEASGIVDLVRRARTDLLFVAFGAPQQDLWIAQNLSATGASLAMGVGGTFDYVAGTARRAPRWMRNAGLEWMWRLIRQPWRWKRMLALPRFAWLVLKSQKWDLLS